MASALALSSACLRALFCSSSSAAACFCICRLCASRARCFWASRRSSVATSAVKGCTTGLATLVVVVSLAAACAAASAAESFFANAKKATLPPMMSATPNITCFDTITYQPHHQACSIQAKYYHIRSTASIADMMQSS